MDISNGQSHGPWVQVGSPATVNMATTVYVGLALTGQGGNHNTSHFDHVTVTGTSGPLPASVLELTDGGFGEAGGAFLNNRVGIQNFTTNFTFQLTPGTQPMADGMAFVIQGNGTSPVTNVQFGSATSIEDESQTATIFVTRSFKSSLTYVNASVAPSRAHALATP